MIGPTSKISGKNRIANRVSIIWLQIESYNFGHLKYHLSCISTGYMQLQQNSVLHLKHTMFIHPSPFSRSTLAKQVGHLLTSFWQKSFPKDFLDELLHDLPGCQASLHLRHASLSQLWHFTRFFPLLLIMGFPHAVLGHHIMFRLMSTSLANLNCNKCSYCCSVRWFCTFCILSTPQMHLKLSTTINPSI